MDHQYVCKSCEKHFTLPSHSKFCPFCGGDLQSKAEIYALEKADELRAMLPALNEKYMEFAQMYSEFKKINEALRTYAARGIIDRSAVVDFAPEGLTEIFYKSRKKRTKENK